MKGRLEKKETLLSQINSQTQSRSLLELTALVILRRSTFDNSIIEMALLSIRARRLLSSKGFLCFAAS